ncbi:MAG TPA: class E sortase [Euzebya sp.]|nr:class E sortase [Euzebya sp.]
MRMALRATGWLFIAAGVLVALYLVHALYWTGLATSRAQDALRDSFQQEVGAIEPLESFQLELGALEPLGSGTDDPTATDPLPRPDDVDIGEAVAAMEFFRPSEQGTVVLDEPVVVLEGVTIDALQDGPGRYPGTAYPGHWGNFGVAGHRTTNGGPFWNLDQLKEGDQIHVTDRNGTRWVYAYVETRIVAPSDVSVLADDPLQRDRPMLTLTTCHPRWSQTERLIVFAELIEEQLPLVPAA